jgi:radical SAM protein with 4Fe4S-binding SPASM domain
LVRDDFEDIYLALKRKGLLVSIFTNASLINQRHISLFKHYPPHEIEVTVYGVTRTTFGLVTRRPSSFSSFLRGLDLLSSNHIPVRLKAMAMKSNIHELPQIAAFCRQRTKDYFRFDPLLHLRYDGNNKRNEEIRAERLSPPEIVEIEQSDDERMNSLIKHCHDFIMDSSSKTSCDHLFRCGAGMTSFVIGHDGFFRICSSLNEPTCIYDLRSGSLSQAWYEIIPKIRAMRTASQQLIDKCARCSIINLCLWCPAHAHLESGTIDAWSEYFCQVAHARAEMLKSKTKKQGSASVALKKNSKSILNSGPKRKDTPPIS